MYLAVQRVGYDDWDSHGVSCIKERFLFFIVFTGVHLENSVLLGCKGHDNRMIIAYSFIFR